MKVLYAVSEAKPFIASGGLADVAGSLLNHRGSLFHAAGYIRPDTYSGGAQFIIEDLAVAG